MSLSPAAARWLSLVREYESSDLSVREFARRHDVNPSTFSSWKSRLRRMGHLPSSSPFYALEVSQPEPVDETEPPDPDVYLALEAFPVTIRVRNSTDLALVRRLVEALC